MAEGRSLPAGWHRDTGQKKRCCDTCGILPACMIFCWLCFCVLALLLCIGPACATSMPSTLTSPGPIAAISNTAAHFVFLCRQTWSAAS